MDIINSMDVSKYYPEDIPYIKTKLPTCNIHFRQGAHLDIKDVVKGDKYRASFTDLDSGKEIYTMNLESNGWGKTSAQYFVNWRIEVKKGNDVIFYHRYNAKDQKVLITLDSKSLGDTLCWLNFCMEFKNKHQCELVVSSFHNYFFEKVYPEITFVKPGTVVDGLYASYTVGVFHSDRQFKNPRDWRTIPLQRVASDILGLEYKEMKPKIDTSNIYTSKKFNKYITISEFSTASCKEWHYSKDGISGWQLLVDMINQTGYDVVVISSEPTKLKNIIDATGNDISVTMGNLMGAEYHIGLASGLCWLAWALNKQVVMISGFSEKWVEFQSGNIRIEGTGPCVGCLNNIFFPSRCWDENCFTDSDYSCTKDITPQSVFERLPIIPIKEISFTTAPILRGSRRQTTFKKFLSTVHNFLNPNIIEIGTVRKKSTEDINERAGDGNSSSIFSWYCYRYSHSHFTSVDIDPIAISNCKENLESQRLLTDNVELICTDGLEFLKNYDKTITGLYLDGWDYNKGEEEKSAEFHLSCFQLAEKNFIEGSIILIDDIFDSNYRGKGELAIPWALNTGKFELICCEYQALLKYKGERK
jgi:autotransporter strand-loop-strand O-heptosyltransferase